MKATKIRPLENFPLCIIQYGMMQLTVTVYIELAKFKVHIHYPESHASSLKLDCIIDIHSHASIVERDALPRPGARKLLLWPVHIFYMYMYIRLRLSV